MSSKRINKYIEAGTQFVLPRRLSDDERRGKQQDPVEKEDVESPGKHDDDAAESDNDEPKKKRSRKRKRKRKGSSPLKQDAPKKKRARKHKPNRLPSSSPDKVISIHDSESEAIKSQDDKADPSEPQGAQSDTKDIIYSPPWRLNSPSASQGSPPA